MSSFHFLTKEFLLNFSKEAVHLLEKINKKEVIKFLNHCDPEVVTIILHHANLNFTVHVFPKLTRHRLNAIIPKLENSIVLVVLSNLSKRELETVLNKLEPALKRKVTTLLHNSKYIISKSIVTNYFTLYD